METALPITDLAELYIIDEVSGNILKAISGDALAFSKRTFDNRRTIFKVNIQSKTNLKLFLHLKSDGEVLKIPVILHSADHFIKMVSFEELIFGVFYGILVIVALIYFFSLWLCATLSFYTMFCMLFLLGSCNSHWMVFFMSL